MTRITTVTVDKYVMASQPFDQREAYIMKLVKQALTGQIDLLLLPELCWCYGADWDQYEAWAETRNSERVRLFARLAREHRAYIALPILERRGERLYNTLILFDRQGQIVWHYDKTFLTDSELALGIEGGQQLEPFETDFGPIGAAICFDLNFLELAEHWRRKAVRLVLFSSMYRGGQTLKTWATHARAYMASATSDEGSQIVSPLGDVLASSDHYGPVITRDISFDFAVFHIDHNWQRWDAIRERYGPKVHMEIRSPEAQFILEVRDPALSVQTLIREFHLIPLDQMLVEARRKNGNSSAFLLQYVHTNKTQEISALLKTPVA